MPSLAPVRSHLAALPQLTTLSDALAVPAAAVEAYAPAGARPAVVSALSPRPGGAPVLAVCATGREAEDLHAGLAATLGEDAVGLFPSWETLPHERLSPRSDTVGQRLSVLRRLAHPDAGDATHGRLAVVVAPVRAVLQPVAKGLGELRPVALAAGDEVPLERIVEDLAAAAYARVDLVERRGEFAVRGGILDVFPPTEEHPLRIEMWGDTVEEIRWFKVADQRSLEVAEHGLWAPPCRELLLTPAVRERAAALADQLPGVADLLEKLAQGIAVEGMEALSPALVDGMETLLEVMPPGSVLVDCDPERVRTRAHDLVSTSEEFLQAGWANAAGGSAVPIDLEAVLGTASFRTIAELREQARDLGLGWLDLTPFPGDGADDVLDLGLAPAPTFRGSTEDAVAELRRLVGQDWAVLAATEGPGLAQRVCEVLAEHEVRCRLVPGQAEPEPGVVIVTTGAVGHGFLAPDERLAVITEADLTGAAGGSGTSTKDMRRMPSRRRNQVDPLQLRPGDFVVHEQHGVGRFVEMMQRTVQGATREYLVLEYAASKRGQPGDRLYVPTDQLDQVTRYVGGEQPTLNKMGGSDWQQTKGRARRYVKQIAAELIRLYSARMATTGHAFGPDTPWQRELEDAFAHVETPDQLSTIEEVKADMERAVPMDRLVCGDVGYGKTEIAVRAAFKAIQDGTQVAVLCPTTLLVQQHLNTFSERYAGFPVTVKALSRFQSDAEARAVLAGLADGSVDLVIGTHRLLSREVRFKNLGLVVVDEEQRFGVEHKEQLKALRTSVDVLAMSATPIPRTLEMAVTGIREMSTLATPPEERHPVLTYVGAYDEKTVTAAIRRELLREGQVFLVHNKVSTIERAAARIRELVPEARVATAHGKMGEHKLEQVVVDFWEKRFDVLVCTTIVETGLDISNANTLIVERADRLGLSQLHQLRGRVGRGRERAYSYFLYPPETPLTETALDRLQTIASNTDLGAGMQVAMKDLEIRGAGNLLGGEQSGHIAGVGFDLYVRLVGEAVASFRGEGEEAPAEIRIELPVDAHLPHDYVPHERLRLEMYKKLAAVVDEAQLAEIEGELVDRYGPVPEPVRNLLEVARLRTVAREAGVADISLQGNHVRFGPVELRESQQLRLQRVYPRSILKAATHSLLVPAPRTAAVGGRPLRDRDILEWAAEVLRAVVMDNVGAAARAASAPARG
ncbi:transcription-repair coupling factor [Phycicoccus endophyticus]|uniref:Transcription-repair-coupling factor n=1 Tax=Phycicoccus endophyticus TaxID=1690220 RepID=A0A7G9R2G5_9MICO|nr:transcription-repair coupling factor [Phycicoccus endophyticus]NHI20826.1 transcription-repair coupling factor [Phycicoccus endophyticus]QNN49790.1 transcription-repair coupling factor [Phycicoccus endophyticus]GGL35169.1 transcription-repair-coupling factor [Phycicoccus endophyticus]